MFNNYEVANKISNGYLITVFGELNQIGKQKPYFSVTHETWKATRKGKRDKRYANPVSFGACLHDTERKFPAIADLFEFHLRDVDGCPMYEVENGAYFIKNNDVKALANHLLVSVDEAEKLIALCKGADDEGIKGTLAIYIYENNLHEIWKHKADNLIEKYNLKVHESTL
jgi:hypothetical protein